jgi:hypothetical protein
MKLLELHCEQCGEVIWERGIWEPYQVSTGSDPISGIDRWEYRSKWYHPACWELKKEANELETRRWVRIIRGKR